MAEEEEAVHGNTFIEANGRRFQAGMQALQRDGAQPRMPSLRGAQRFILPRLGARACEHRSTAIAASCAPLNGAWLPQRWNRLESITSGILLARCKPSRAVLELLQQRRMVRTARRAAACAHALKPIRRPRREL